MQRGIITIWSGSIATIPAGWLLCDGNNGTPNLKNRFVVGAGDSYAVDATGGTIGHGHAFTGDGHTHDLTGGIDIGAGAVFGDTTGSNPATGTTDATNHRPPYYALAYIMKS